MDAIMKVMFEPTKGFYEEYEVKFTYLNASGFTVRSSVKAYVSNSRKAHKQVEESFKRKFSPEYKDRDLEVYDVIYY